MTNYTELEEERAKRAAAEAEVLRLQALLREANNRTADETSVSESLRQMLTGRGVFIQNVSRAVHSALYIFNLSERSDIFINDRLHPLLHYTADELRDLKPNIMAALLHPDDKLRMKQHYAALENSSDEVVLPIEFRLKTKAGNWKWFRGHHTVFARDEQGTVTQIMGSAEDISEQKAATERVAWQKEFYENILQSIPADIEVFNPDHTFLFSNFRNVPDPTMRAWLIGKPDIEYCLAQNMEPAVCRRRREKFQEALETQKEVTWEDATINASQKKRYNLRKYHPVLDSRGEVNFVIGYGLDVTRLKHTEQQLENQQAFVQQVIETSPNPIYVKDEEGQIILANKAFASLYGLSATELLAKGQIGEDYAKEHDQEILKNNSTISFEELYELPYGRSAWYHTTKKPFMRPDGSRYLLVISSDITDLKQARAVAEESAQAKELFLANMSHEIRTPMHGIMGLAQLLRKGKLASEQADYVDMILSSTENLLVVINDILDFAKVESGKLDLEAIPFDIVKAVREATKSLSFKAEEKGLALFINGTTRPLPVVEGDPYRLRQILLNLTNNAIKFTQRGEVTVSIEASEQAGRMLYLTFSVADTGIGISEDKFDHIFESFSQASNSTSRMFGGTGLGLTICKNLVELQGGKIWVESEEGKGSCFHFTIPYLISEKSLASNNTPEINPALLKGLNVLLAEDSQINQLIATSMLKAWQVSVDVANDGEEALLKAAQKAYDIILMDIQMPRMNGMEATARLRSEPNPNQQAPIIALTANALKNDVESYQASGFTAHLVKPFHEIDFFQAIVKLTRQPVVHKLMPKNEGIETDAIVTPYDFSGLGKLADDTNFVQKMQRMFVERVPVQLAQIHQAVEIQDWATIAQHAHSLKATFGSLGIRVGEANLKIIEQLAEKQADRHEFQAALQIVAATTRTVVDLFMKKLEEYEVLS